MIRISSRRSILLGVMSALVLAACSGNDATVTDSGSEPALDAARAAEIDGFVREALARYDVPGAAVAIVRDGEIQYTGAFGVLGLEDPRPVTSDTLFMIGSVNKSMTTLMMASLADDGLLDFDAPVTDIVPSFALSNPASTPLIRVRDLVNHSSGVPRYDLPVSLESMPPLRLIASLRDIPTVAAPGEVYGYSNQMVATGGFVAAHLAGYAYEDDALTDGYRRLMDERVFSPLGMRRTTIDFDAAIADSNHALPHVYDPTRRALGALPLGLERSVLPIAPTGGAWSDITDVARFASTQLAGGVSPDGVRAVSRENLALTHEPGVANGPGQHYAMGWVVEDDFMGLPALWHDGGTMGFTALVKLLPTEQTGIVVLSNSADADGLCAAITRFVAETLLGREHPGDAEVVEAQRADRDAMQQFAAATAPVDEADAAAVVGRYSYHTELVRSDAGLELRTDFGAYPLVSVSPGVLATGGFATGLALAQLESDPDGARHLLLGTPAEQGLDQIVVLDRLGD